MELKDVLLNRRSVRKYTEQTIDSATIDELMHAAMSGPSACNVRPWDFYVVTDPEKLEELRAASKYTNIKAPMAIVVCGNINGIPNLISPFWVQDCSAATMNILLRAEDLGLGTVWCGIYPQEVPMKNVSEALNLPEKVIPLNIIHVGYPAERPIARDQYDNSKIHIVS